MAREKINIPGIDLTIVSNRQALMRQVGSLTGVYDVELIPRKPRRSDAQNRYFHGVVCTMLARAMQDQGNDHADLDYAKSYLKEKYLKEPVVHRRTGELAGHVVLETKNLPVDRMAKFIDLCIAHCADFWDLVIPDPGEYGCERKEMVSA